MAWCDSCDRYFASHRALEDHYENSSRHNWCRKCDRHFNSPAAILTHRVNNGNHNYCRGCDEDFEEYDDLQEHIQDEHYHCDDCDMFFVNDYGLREHYRQSSEHAYCSSCNQLFRNENNLKMHLKSSIHVGRTFNCPGCPKAFPSVAALTLHFESSACSSGMTRRKLNAAVRSYDTQNLITTRLLTGPKATVQSTYATQASWNGQKFECYFCSRQFSTLPALNQHLASPAHEGNTYKCPHCQVQFICLSGLVQHVESEKCGVMKFGAAKRVMQGLTDNLQRLIL